MSRPASSSGLYGFCTHLAVSASVGSAAIICSVMFSGTLLLAMTVGMISTAPPTRIASRAITVKTSALRSTSPYQ